jgi:hypothetical protein
MKVYSYTYTHNIQGQMQQTILHDNLYDIVF